MRNEILHTAVAAFAWLVLIAACIVLSGCSGFQERYAIGQQCRAEFPPSGLSNFGLAGAAYRAVAGNAQDDALDACLKARGFYARGN